MLPDVSLSFNIHACWGFRCAAGHCFAHWSSLLKIKLCQFPSCLFALLKHANISRICTLVVLSVLCLIKEQPLFEILFTSIGCQQLLRITQAHRTCEICRTYTSVLWQLGNLVGTLLNQISFGSCTNPFSETVSLMWELHVRSCNCSGRLFCCLTEWSRQLPNCSEASGMPTSCPQDTSWLTLQAFGLPSYKLRGGFWTSHLEWHQVCRYASEVVRCAASRLDLFIHTCFYYLPTYLPTNNLPL
jgi:hypothetical protein